MDDFFAPEGAIQQLISFLLFSYQSRPTPFMPFLISPGLRLYEFLITNARPSALRHVTRELSRTCHLAAAHQRPPQCHGASWARGTRRSVRRAPGTAPWRSIDKP